MKKQQLTAANRGAIEVLLKENYTLKNIGDRLGFDKSTISREINKRSTPSGYNAKIARS